VKLVISVECGDSGPVDTSIGCRRGYTNEVHDPNGRACDRFETHLRLGDFRTLGEGRDQSARKRERRRERPSRSVRLGDRETRYLRPPHGGLSEFAEHGCPSTRGGF